MPDDSWSVAEAKAKFSELFERALREGPQRVARRGRDAVMVVREEAWLKRSHPSRTLYDLFERSPLRGTDETFTRITGRVRDVEP